MARFMDLPTWPNRFISLERTQVVIQFLIIFYSTYSSFSRHEPGPNVLHKLLNFLLFPIVGGVVDKTEDSKDVFDPLTVDYVREHCQQAEEIECRARAAQEMVVSKYIIFELQHIVTLCILRIQSGQIFVWTP